MDVLMRREPEAVLIVHDVEAHAAVGGFAPRADQMPHVTLLKVGVHGNIRIGGIVPSDGGVAGDANAVAGVGQVRVHRGLRAVLGPRITVENASVGAEDGRPADHRHRHQRLRAADPAVGDEAVGGLTRCRAGIGIAFEIIIRPFAMGIDLPIIRRLLVAARAIHGEIQILDLVRRGKGRPINLRTNWLALGGNVDTNEIGRVRPRRRPGHQFNVIEIECRDG